jgi:predicted amidohydrolase YtcJ
VKRQRVLFAGCRPEVAGAPDGRILAVGDDARAAAGAQPEVHHLSGRAYPGFGDAHLHLEWMALSAAGVDLAGTRTRAQALARLAGFARTRPAHGWVQGSGWCNDDWSDDARMLTRAELDAAAAGRPVLLVRRDGHSACLSSAALVAAGILRDTRDPRGGVIDRDGSGEPTGVVREEACNLARRALPPPPEHEFDDALEKVLNRLARHGLTTVHTMDGPLLFGGLQRLHSRRRLPIRVVWNLPVEQLHAAVGLGISSGLGDAWLRIWGVKVFLDGSLGSRTAEMLDGGGVAVTPQEDLVEVVRRCAGAHLNVCLHAIGDGAVRRALDALEPLRGAWPMWRPRIEHAQCVDPADVPRFGQLGVIASMQPAHAVADRAVAELHWPSRTASSYAWGALRRAGATLAFGSDAPVEDPSPLRGIDAATGWRVRSGWHPELALGRAAALRAYTFGVAYAAGMEREVGGLREGMRCDLTVVARGRVVATVVDGRLAWRAPVS